MEKQKIIISLREHAPTLRRLGLKSLALFGSFARGDAGQDSDIDLLYEFEEGQATLDHYLELQDLLERLFRRKVELVPRKYVSAGFQRYIADDVEPVYPAEGG
ncbi:MAG: nucleotidyltransferase [Bacteroidetes bacterium]|nr:MAG: nucleotidyltransferase [Bacteroidota bacterium]